MITAFALGLALSGPGEITFPVKVDRQGFLAGIWDVGAAYVSGQPTEDAFRELAKEGIKTVICVRGTAEMDDRTVVTFDEAALLRELGINYVHIPMGTDAEYNPTVITRFAEAFEKADSKVLLHCTVAWRASYVWSTYLHVRKGMPFEQAVKVGSAMNISANRIEKTLGIEMGYDTAPATPGSRKPKAGVFTKSGAKLTLHEPKAVNPPNPDDYMAFVMWDMGSVLNSSQPDEAKLRELAKQGVKTVINIRTEAEMAAVPFDEAALTKELGMKYVRIVFSALDSFNPTNLAALAKALDESQGKVLFHCQSATRTSNIWAAYLTKYQGVPLDEAMKHAEAMRYSNVYNMLLGRDVLYKVKTPPAGKPCGGGLED